MNKEDYQQGFKDGLALNITAMEILVEEIRELKSGLQAYKLNGANEVVQFHKMVDEAKKVGLKLTASKDGYFIANKAFVTMMEVKRLLEGYTSAANHFAPKRGQLGWRTKFDERKSFD